MKRTERGCMTAKQLSHAARAFGTAVRYSRTANGWTLAFMAKKVGLSTSQLSRIENGSPPSFAARECLVRVMNG